MRPRATVDAGCLTDALRLRRDTPARALVGLPAEPPLRRFASRISSFIAVPLGNSKMACSSDHSLVIASELNACSLGADELDRCQMNGV